MTALRAIWYSALQILSHLGPQGSKMFKNIVRPWAIYKKVCFFSKHKYVNIIKNFSINILPCGSQQINKTSHFFSSNFFSIFYHQTPGSVSVFSLKCGSAINESKSKTLQIREAKLVGVFLT
jgi:hypothetical protein